jgi:hypothetical protein
MMLVVFLNLLVLLNVELVNSHRYLFPKGSYLRSLANYNYGVALNQNLFYSILREKHHQELDKKIEDVLHIQFMFHPTFLTF